MHIRLRGFNDVTHVGAMLTLTSFAIVLRSSRMGSLAFKGDRELGIHSCDSAIIEVPLFLKSQHWLMKNAHDRPNVSPQVQR